MDLPKIPGLVWEQKVGEGAFAEVWRARQGKRDVAVKVLSASGRQEAGAAVRMRIEAAALARVGGPFLPQIYAYGEDGGPYIIMELLPGQILENRIATAVLDQAAVSELLVSLSRSLMRIHDAGLIHRDVKPANIMITSSQSFRLFDIGFAGDANRRGDEGQLGTAFFAAPEQLGLLDKGVDHRADLYAMGAVAFQAATGQSPFGTGSIAEILQRKKASVRSLGELAPNLPKSITSIVDALLSPNPEDRPASAAKVLDGLLAAPDANEAPNLGRARSVHVDFLVDLLQQAKNENRPSSVSIISSTARAGTTQALRDVERSGTNEDIPVTYVSVPEGSAPFETVINALANIVESGPENRIELFQSSVGDLLGYLCGVSPALAQRFANTPPLAAEDQGQLAEILEQTIRRLRATIPQLVLILDGLEHADGSTKSFIRRLSSETSQQALPLVVCSITADTELVDSFASRQVVPFPRLTPEKTRALLFQELGGASVSAELLSWAAVTGKDLAGRLSDVIGSSLRHGALSYAEGTWTLDEKRLGSLELDNDATTLDLLLGELPENPHQKALVSAAAMGTEVSVGMLQEALGMSERVVRMVLADASRAGLLLPGEADHARFARESLRHLLASRVDSARRNALRLIAGREHLRLADNDPAELPAAAKHFLELDDPEHDEWVEDVYARAAEFSLDRFDYSDAGIWWSASEVVRSRTGIAALPRHHIIAARLAAAEHRVEAAIEEYTKASLGLTDIDRAKVYFEIANLYSAVMRYDDALGYLHKGFEEVGGNPSPNPLRTLVNFLRIGLRPPTMPDHVVGDRDQEVAMLRAKLHETGSFINFVLWDQKLQGHHSVFALDNAIHAGKQRDALVFASRWAIVLGSMRKSELAEKFLARCHEYALEIGDPTLDTEFRMSEAIGLEFSSKDPATSGNRMLQVWEKGRPFIGLYYLRTLAIVLSYNLIGRGYWREVGPIMEVVLERLGLAFDEITEYQPSAFQAIAAVVADDSSWEERMADSEGIVEKLVEKEPRHEPVLRVDTAGHKAFCLIEAGRLGDELESVLPVAESLSIPGTPLLSTVLSAPLAAYGYLRRIMVSDGHDPVALESMKRSLGTKKMRYASSRFSIIGLHFRFLKAALESLESGQGATGWDEVLLDADRADAPWVTYEVLAFQAWWNRKCGNVAVAQRYAGMAHSLATRHGWTRRERSLVQGYDLDVVAQTTTQDAGSVLQEQLDSVMEISRVSASIVEPQEVARVALGKLVELMGADRAVLFTGTTESTITPLAVVERGMPVASSAEIVGYSATVVGKALHTRQT
ncbi:MAG: serine/threonine-protein kinase PknK, partial [Myxococcales bacterium]|nr:serine/threonine-protein kinase PknK [Myxococcales bacterium]